MSLADSGMLSPEPLGCLSIASASPTLEHAFGGLHLQQLFQGLPSGCWTSACKCGNQNAWDFTSPLPCPPQPLTNHCPVVPDLGWDNSGT